MENVIVGVIVFVAAVYLVRYLVRGMGGRDDPCRCGCEACGPAQSCPALEQKSAPASDDGRQDP